MENEGEESGRRKRYVVRTLVVFRNCCLIVFASVGLKGDKGWSGRVEGVLV